MAGQSKADQALQGPLSDREGPGSYSTLSGLMPEIIVVSLFLNVLSLALPLVLLQVYDRIVPNAALGTLSFLVIGVGGALMLESILRLGRSYVTGWVGARFEHMSGVASLRRLLFTGIQDFEKTGSGVHLERMGALAVVKDFYAGQSLISIIDLPFAFLYLGIIYLLGGWLVVIPLVLLACFILTAYLLGRELKGAIKDRMTFDDRRINFIIEILNGSHTLKSMAMEAQMLRRYERLQETCGKGNYRVALASAWALSAGAFFSQATMVATVAVGAWLVVGQEMTMGALAACTLLAGRSLAPVQKVLGVWTRFQTIRLARARLQEIFALEPEAVAGLPEPQGVEGRLTLDNVSFQFDGTSEPMLKELNLDAAPGECIGISGGNGSGKSTLLGLMSGALKATTGQVRVDGVDVLSYDPKAVKAHVAYLPQNGELFRGTILENITMYQPELNEAAVAQAEALGLGPVVATMALGYDTLVGEGAGESLPRGIRQRIAVARALMPRPQVVLFDEANTAVDGAGDEHLKQCLEALKGERTIILVTHRPSLLRVADRVFDLEDGRLRERPPVDAVPQFPAPIAPEPKADPVPKSTPDAKPAAAPENPQATPQAAPEPTPAPKPESTPAPEPAALPAVAKTVEPPVPPSVPPAPVMPAPPPAAPFVAQPEAPAAPSIPDAKPVVEPVDPWKEVAAEQGLQPIGETVEKPLADDRVDDGADDAADDGAALAPQPWTEDPTDTPSAPIVEQKQPEPAPEVVADMAAEAEAPDPVEPVRPGPVLVSDLFKFRQAQKDETEPDLSDAEDAATQRPMSAKEIMRHVHAQRAAMGPAATKRDEARSGARRGQGGRLGPSDFRDRETPSAFDGRGGGWRR